MPFRGGGRRLMAKTILDFHFDYLNPSLSQFASGNKRDLEYCPNFYFFAALLVYIRVKDSASENKYLASFSIALAFFCGILFTEKILTVMSFPPDTQTTQHTRRTNRCQPSYVETRQNCTTPPVWMEFG